MSYIVQLPKKDFSLHLHSPLFFLGSCFSDHLSQKSIYSGLNAEHNPNGTIFNPFSLAKYLNNTMNQNAMLDSIFQQDDLFFSWEASRLIYGFEQAKIEQLLTEKMEKSRSLLSRSQVLFITFGTAWVYTLKETKQIVANCHKVPKEKFQKHLLTVEEITGQWKEVIDKLRKYNPRMEIVFTVSPVRHYRDGGVENARSKAILLESIHRIIEQTESTSYFPSYEMVIDELRDYSYFEVDTVHPNKRAIDIIWKRFLDYYFDPSDIQVIQKFNSLAKMMHHKSIHPGSKADQKHKTTTEQLFSELKNQFPFLNFDVLDNQFEH